MNILEYLIKLFISIGISYLFYYTVLSRLTFYNWNRFYLLLFSLLSFLIAFINITPVLKNSTVVQTPVVASIPVLKEYTDHSLFMGQAVKQGTDITLWVSGIILVGMGVMLLVFIIKCLSFYMVRKQARLLQKKKGIKIYDLDADIIPFSFGKSIYINPRLHSDREYNQIILHETIHVQQKHTADILFAEFFCIINWYNPFAWLMRASIRQNLEFIADNKVLQRDSDKSFYQALLLKESGVPRFAVAHQFNFSSLKSRIVMMHKSNSPAFNLTRFILLVPVMIFMLLSFRSPELHNLARQLQPLVQFYSVKDMARPHKTDQKKRKSIVEEKNQLRKGSPSSVTNNKQGTLPDQYYTVSGSSKKEEVELLKSLLLSKGYELNIVQERYEGNNLVEFSGSLGGAPMQNDLTTSMNFKIAGTEGSTLGFNPVTGKLKMYASSRIRSEAKEMTSKTTRE